MERAYRTSCFRTVSSARKNGFVRTLTGSVWWQLLDARPCFKCGEDDSCWKRFCCSLAFAVSRWSSSPFGASTCSAMPGVGHHSAVPMRRGQSHLPMTGNAQLPSPGPASSKAWTENPRRPTSTSDDRAG